MASLQASSHLLVKQIFTASGVSGAGGTTTFLGTMIAARALSLIAFLATVAKPKTSRTTGLAKLEIVASEDAAGQTNLTVVKSTGTIEATAAGDHLALECTAEEVAQLSGENGTHLRYVGARLTLIHAEDVVAISALGVSNEPHLGLNADLKSAIVPPST